jgi:CTP:molybdopterin cytidylyltransferase MocA/predicted hydrolase (HD superfamily)
MKTALVILAAGLSSRMGVSKPLLPVGGKTALERALHLGRAANADCTLVVTGHRRKAVEAELGRLALPRESAVYNERYQEGMFTSVQAGVSALPPDTDAFFLLPVDCCAVSTETLMMVQKAYERLESPALVCPVYAGTRGHPPLIPTAFVRDIQNYTGPNGMQGYLSSYPSVTVDVPDRGSLLDMDTPQDYGSLLRYLSLPTYPTKGQCLALLKEAGTPERVLRHSRAVLTVALDLARQLNARGVTIDENLLSAAALLHDMLRHEPSHAEAAAKHLLARGYPDVAVPIALHMDRPEDLPFSPDEAALLYLADKLVREDKIVPLEETLRHVTERFRDNPEALSGARRRIGAALEIAHRLREDYGIVLPKGPENGG